MKFISSELLNFLLSFEKNCVETITIVYNSYVCINFVSLCKYFDPSTPSAMSVLFTIKCHTWVKLQFIVYHNIY